MAPQHLVPFRKLPPRTRSGPMAGSAVNTGTVGPGAARGPVGAPTGLSDVIPTADDLAEPSTDAVIQGLQAEVEVDIPAAEPVTIKAEPEPAPAPKTSKGRSKSLPQVAPD